MSTTYCPSPPKACQRPRPVLEGRWLDRPWGRLRVWRAGAGPVVLALHGLGGSGRYWEALARGLAGGRTLVAPDLAGFGRSDKPSMRYDRDLHLGNLDAVVESVAPGERVVVVGHSVGAILAALWAARRPERVRALVLVAAPFPTARALPPPARWVRDRPPTVRRRTAGTLVRIVWPIVTLPLVLSRSYPRAVVDDFVRQSIQGRAWTAWATLVDPAVLDALTSLRDLPTEVKVLLLNADDDRRTPAVDVARWLQLLPRARLLTATRGGHHLLLRGGSARLAGWIRDA